MTSFFGAWFESVERRVSGLKVYERCIRDHDSTRDCKDIRVNLGWPSEANQSLYLSVCILFHAFKRQADDCWLNPGILMGSWIRNLAIWKSLPRHVTELESTRLSSNVAANTKRGFLERHRHHTSLSVKRRRNLWHAIQTKEGFSWLNYPHQNDSG